MDKAPAVSVVIPTYNRAHLIGRSIQSVLLQTFKDWDIWIVDDNSGDDTERVVSAFNDPRIHYLRHETNRGASAARNSGVHASRGEYVAFLDSDDEWVPTKLEKQLALFRNGSKNLGLAYSASTRIRDNVTTVWNPSLRGSVYNRVLREGCDAGTNCFMVPRNVFLAVGGFDENLPALEDYDLLLRISKHYEIDFLEEPVVILHQASCEDRLSNNLKRQISSFEALFQKHLNELKLDRPTFAIWLNAAGDLYCRNGDFKKQRAYYLRSLKVRPFQLKPLLHAALSSHPRLHQAFFSAWRAVFWRFHHGKSRAWKMLNDGNVLTDN